MRGQSQCVTALQNDEADAAADRARSRRREVLWAWASLLVLVICWDAAIRLDEHVSPPRVRIAHAVDEEVSDRSLHTAARFE